MKTQFNCIKNVAFAIGVTALLVGTQSCKKTETVTPTPIPTETFTLVGTWSLVSADVVVNGKSYPTITATDIAKTPATKGPYPADDFVFTSDGKYTRGKESGTWTLATSAQLKLKNTVIDLSYEFSNNDATTMQFGNTWDLIASPNPTTAQGDAPISAQALLNTIDVGIPGASLANVKYRVNYKKKA
jgi:hypothetical protein